VTYKHVAGVVGTFIFAYDFSLFTYRARFAGACVGVKLMLAINSVQLALIELEYSAADCLRLEASISDPLERAELELLLPNIIMARAIVKSALAAIQIWHAPADAARDPNAPG
jgi:hypothetical protein